MKCYTIFHYYFLLLTIQISSRHAPCIIYWPSWGNEKNYQKKVDYLLPLSSTADMQIGQLKDTGENFIPRVIK